MRVNRFITLTLGCLILAACGQADTEGTVAESPAARAPETAQTAPPAAQAATAEPAAAASTGVSNDGAVTPAAGAPLQLAQADTDALTAAGFVEGQHYFRLSPTQPTSTSPGQVEVAEFFMYSCIHCYNLEPYVQAWLPNKPDHINFVRVPTTWNEVVRLHAQAFYAAAALGKGEEMHLPFFQAMHVDGNYLETPAKLRDFFSRFGVSAADFDSVFSSFSVVTQVNRADELGRRYRVDSTPTIVINGKYRTGVSDAGGTPEDLFRLIEALAAAELGR